MGLFCVLAIVNIISLCRCKRLFEIGNTCLYKDVIPLKQLLDITVVHTILVEIRQHFSEISTEFFRTQLPIVYRNLFTAFLLANSKWALIRPV